MKRNRNSHPSAPEYTDSPMLVVIGNSLNCLVVVFVTVGERVGRMGGAVREIRKLVVRTGYPAIAWLGPQTSRDLQRLDQSKRHENHGYILTDLD